MTEPIRIVVDITGDAVQGVWSETLTPIEVVFVSSDRDDIEFAGDTAVVDGEKLARYKNVAMHLPSFVDEVFSAPIRDGEETET